MSDLIHGALPDPGLPRERPPADPNYQPAPSALDDEDVKAYLDNSQESDQER